MIEQLKEQLRQLPTDEKREAVELLIDWLQDEREEPVEFDPELKAELDRRLGEYRKNPETGRPWREVFAELRARNQWQS